MLSSTAIFVLDILPAVVLDEPVSVCMVGAGFGPRGCVFKLTPFSTRSCPDASTPDESLDVVLARWRARFNSGQPFDSETLDLALAMPPPHAVLCTCGAWRFWGFPVVQGRQGTAMGIHLLKFWNLKPWFDASGASSLPLGDAHVLSEDALQGVADTLRAQAAGVADPREVEFYVGWVQRLRDRMVTDDIRKCRKMYNTHHLVTVMMLAGVASKVDLR